MAITTPDAVPGEIIEAAWGDAVRADLQAHDTAIPLKVAKAGDTMSGALTINGPVAGALTANGRATFSNFADYSAVHIGTTIARVTSTAANSGANIMFERHGDTDATGGTFTRFYRGGANTLIGTITQASSTTTAYNTTSDKRLKELTRPVDGVEAVAKLAALEPVHFTWVDYPEQGEDIGFFAQDVHPVAPEMVAVGSGEPGDAEFTPWGIDNAKLVPTLVAAINALAARVAALEAGSP